MDKKMVYATVAGIAMYVVILALAYVQRDLTG